MNSPPCTTMATKAAVGLHQPPEGRQQVGDQLCLRHNVIRASGPRRLPVGGAFQHSQVESRLVRARTLGCRPQVGCGSLRLSAGSARYDAGDLSLSFASFIMTQTRLPVYGELSYL